MLVFLWSLVVGAVFGLGGWWISPNLIVLGPVAFVASLLFLGKVWKES